MNIMLSVFFRFFNPVLGKDRLDYNSMFQSNLLGGLAFANRKCFGQKPLSILLTPLKYRSVQETFLPKFKVKEHK